MIKTILNIFPHSISMASLDIIGSRMTKKIISNRHFKGGK